MKWKEWMIIVGMITGVYIGIKYILPVSIPFLLGWILALFSYTIAAKFCLCSGAQKLHLTQRRIAVGIIIFLAGTVIVLLGGILHFCADGIAVVLGNWSYWDEGMQETIGKCCQNLEGITGIAASRSSSFIYERIDDCQNIVMSYLKSQEFMKGTVSSVKYIFVLLSLSVISIISGILLVRDFEYYRDLVMRYELFRRFWKVLQNMGNGLRLYLKAQMKIMSAVGILCAVGLFLLGIPYAWIWGVGIGLLDALPVLGTGMVLVPWAIWSFLQNRLWQAGGLLLLFVLASVLRQFLEPKWLGKDLGVQPLFVLASIYFGVVIYGGSGFFLGPLSALLIWYMVREWKKC